MIPPLKPGVKLLKLDGPVIETARLILRQWRSGDMCREYGDAVRSRHRALHHA